MGIVIGALFGALVDYQSLLTGVSSGLMAGIMGPMIGVMASDMGMIAFCTILVYLHIWIALFFYSFLIFKKADLVLLKWNTRTMMANIKEKSNRTHFAKFA